ncbi:14880_t:CDS:2, partial [Rhizophagus irregularis]
DFQNVRINDRMNQKSDVYADWSSEVNKARITTEDRIYDDLETSDLPSKADNKDSEEPLNPSLLDRNDTKDDKNDFCDNNPDEDIFQSTVSIGQKRKSFPK